MLSMLLFSVLSLPEVCEFLTGFWHSHKGFLNDTFLLSWCFREGASPGSSYSAILLMSHSKTYHFERTEI